MQRMSDISPLHPDAIPATNEPLRIAVRRLRWFKQAFQRHVAAYGRDLGCTFAVDEAKLASVFMRWLAVIDRQKPSDKTERRDFFKFASGLMLGELVTRQRRSGPKGTVARCFVCLFMPPQWHRNLMRERHLTPQLMTCGIGGLFGKTHAKTRAFLQAFCKWSWGKSRTGRCLMCFARGLPGKSNRVWLSRSLFADETVGVTGLC
jgi:hypothetical protein